MDCYNQNCPFRVNTTSSSHYCSCSACPKRQDKQTTYYTSSTTVETEQNYYTNDRTVNSKWEK